MSVPNLISNVNIAVRFESGSKVVGAVSKID